MTLPTPKWLNILALLGVIETGVLAYQHWPSWLSPPKPPPTAVLTNLDGALLPTVIAPNTLLGLSSKASQASAVVWDVSPASVQSLPVDAVTRVLVAPPDAQTVTIRLTAVQNGALAQTTKTILVGDAPSPPDNPPKPPDPPSPPSGPAALGHAYGLALATTNAAAWRTAAAAWDAHEPMDQTLKALAANWQTTRTATFDAEVLPALEAIVKSGTEPTPAQYTELAAFARAFAHGEDGK